MMLSKNTFCLFTSSFAHDIMTLCGVYGLEVKCSASHAKGTGFDPRSVHACFSVIRPTVLIFPSSLHVKDPLLVPELGQSSKISKLNVRHLG